ncbi:AEC family transporter [Nitrincola sp. MINF-07-Sa-05]|uniref:AEC family transporter n=1 Tax=Nitrincola salilacus TaxID=3400273 RepID=UPI00391842A7
MQQILSALWPVFALLMLGYLARSFRFPGDAFWQPAERATYYVLFPALLVRRLSDASLSGDESMALVLAVLLLLALGTLLCFLLRPLLQLPAAAFTSFYQGGMRFNTFVALAASAALYSDSGIALAAVIAAVMIPLLNLLCILVFARYTSASPSLAGVLKTLVTNPLILACLLGLLINVTLGGLPALVVPVFDLLAQMALPLGLLAVGAGLSLPALRHSGRALAAASVVKLLALPLLAWGLARLLHLSDEATGVFLLFASVPTATSAYILARQLQGDAPLMAAIITGQTLLSMLSMPLILHFLG